MGGKKKKLNNQRAEILAQLEAWLETPLLILGFVWLALLVVDLVRGLTPFLQSVSNLIWIIFIVDFTLKFALAPAKIQYLKSNLLTLVALLIPALRVFRIFRAIRILQAARLARGVRFVRVLTSLNRGMKSLGASFGRRGFGYVAALTFLILLGGAAGMYAFERDADASGISSYGGALWWTAMLLTSIGSDYFPKTGAGRVLCFLLALYGFMVFGYMTATLSTFFVERDAKSKDSAIADTGKLDTLQKEIGLLRNEIKILGEKLNEKI